MPLSRRTVTALGLLLLLAPAVRAEDKRLVVLPLDTSKTDGRMTPAARVSVEEMLRDAAINALVDTPWVVLDANNTVELLRANNIDPSKCEGECHLETARTLAADAFISGLVQWSDGEFTASIRLLDSQTGRPLASERITGATAKALREAFWSKKENFFVRLGARPAAPAPAPAAAAARPKAGKGTLKVVTRPAGARVLLDGEEIGKSPLGKPVEAGTYAVSLELPGYVAVTRMVTVAPGPPALVNEVLALDQGFLELSVTPLAAAKTATVAVDGAPASLGRRTLKSGPHTVRAEAPGYRAVEVPVDLSSGATVPVVLALALVPGTLLISSNVDATCKAGAASAEVIGGAVSRMEVGAGPAHVVCSRGWYLDAAVDAEVASGKEQAVKVLLQRDPAKTKVEPKSGLEYVLLPGGAFPYGRLPTEKYPNNIDNPVRTVTVGPFWIGTTAVTVAAYARCVQAGACKPIAEKTNCTYPKLAAHPINCLEWDGASAFCAWAGARLLTSEEWEYAARSGEARVYPWGDERPDETRARFRSGAGTAPVGSYPHGATKAGLLDMAGNVPTWTSTGSNYTGMEMRGGGFGGDANALRVSYASQVPKDYAGPEYGVRCGM